MQMKKQLFEGCIVGGALGDALGYTVEFMQLNEIRDRYGEKGIINPILCEDTNNSLVSDDTQMTLFTADGMIWAYLRCSKRGIGSYVASGVYQSYLRWLYTQTRSPIGKQWMEKQPHELENDYIKYNKSILEYSELYARRAPGNSCLSALESGKMGTIEEPINNSKGCGGVMRVAPVGLFLHKDPEYAFRIGSEVAAITHGHPTGYLSAGTLSALIAELINGKTILESAMRATEILRTYKGHEETLRAMDQAIELANGSESVFHSIKKLGQGWIAEEALAIALYSSLKVKDVREALIISVNHDGDSDSTGAICGNIMGAAYGIESLPKSWVKDIELKELLFDLSNKLFVLSEVSFA